jgi:hypothetical protein
MADRSTTSGAGGSEPTFDNRIQEWIDGCLDGISNRVSGWFGSKPSTQSSNEETLNHDGESQGPTQGGLIEAIDNAKKAKKLGDQIISLETLDKRTSAGPHMKATIAKAIAELEAQLKALEKGGKDK